MKLSDAEWTVMHAVWERHPASVRDVLELVSAETDWAYTTVKTILGRLVEKGVLSSHKRANVSLFEPLLTRSQARGSALRSLVEKAFDGTFGSLFQHMLADEKLSKRERTELAELLEDLERGDGKNASRGRR